ncbi:MAG: type VI secretion system-associated FHA domain protein TagH [Nitrosomonas sp.]|nr:type VI secretion system-associated FHA domain protein TagH [Nitrosomonas sp.]
MIRVISCKGLPVTKETFAEFDKQGGTIGRAEGSTLELQDVERSISRTHASILFHESSFFIRGLGLLPVYLNDHPLPNGKDTIIHSGDRIRIGDYALEVVNVSVPGLVGNKIEYSRHDLSVKLDYASDNKLLDKFLTPSEGAHSNQILSDEKKFDKKLKTEFDPFAISNASAPSDKILSDPSDPFANVFSELNRLPKLEPSPSGVTEGLDSALQPENNKMGIDGIINPKDSLLNSLDKDSEIIDPFSQSPVPEENKVESSTGDSSERIAARKSIATSDEELLRAFLDGAGVPELAESVELTPQLMNLIGQLLRDSTQGTRDLLRARMLTKQEMHVPPTLMGCDENNPLKFTPNVEMALTYLLTPQKRGFMTPSQAMKDSYDDLRSHQFGIMAGMRAALLGVLKRFNPNVLEQRLERKNVIDSMLPVNRKAKLWDLFVERYVVTSQEAQEDFQVVFGKEFVQAYETLVAKLENNPKKR